MRLSTNLDRREYINDVQNIKQGTPMVGLSSISQKRSLTIIISSLERRQPFPELYLISVDLLEDLLLAYLPTLLA
jgi:hypothetical protein